MSKASCIQIERAIMLKDSMRHTGERKKVMCKNKLYSSKRLDHWKNAYKRQKQAEHKGHTFLKFMEPISLLSNLVFWKHKTLLKLARRVS